MMLGSLRKLVAMLCHHFLPDALTVSGGALGRSESVV
jgi:hypothetical protein